MESGKRKEKARRKDWETIKERKRRHGGDEEGGRRVEDGGEREGVGI